MSDSNSRLEFIYKNDENKPYLGLNFSYKDDGTALLTNPTCKNRDVILDQSVVEYLKQIQGVIAECCFKTYNGESWFIISLPNTNESAHPWVHSLSGNMIDDGQKITCTNAFLDAVRSE
jgi:hypothetical protein